MALNRNHATEYQWDWGQDSDLTILIYGISSVWTNSDDDLFLCLGTDTLHDPLSLKFQFKNILAMCYTIGTIILKRLQIHTFLSRGTLSFKESFDMSLHWPLKGQSRHDWCKFFSICDQSASIGTDEAPSLQTSSCNLFQTNVVFWNLFKSCHISLWQNSVVTNPFIGQDEHVIGTPDSIIHEAEKFTLSIN